MIRNAPANKIPLFGADNGFRNWISLKKAEQMEREESHASCESARDGSWSAGCVETRPRPAP